MEENSSGKERLQSPHDTRSNNTHPKNKSLWTTNTNIYTQTHKEKDRHMHTDKFTNVLLGAEISAVYTCFYLTQLLPFICGVDVSIHNRLSFVHRMTSLFTNSLFSFSLIFTPCPSLPLSKWSRNLLYIFLLSSGHYMLLAKKSWFHHLFNEEYKQTLTQYNIKSISLFFLPWDQVGICTYNITDLNIQTLQTHKKDVYTILRDHVQTVNTQAFILLSSHAK